MVAFNDDYDYDYDGNYDDDYDYDYDYSHNDEYNMADEIESLKGYVESVFVRHIDSLERLAKTLQIKNQNDANLVAACIQYVAAITLLKINGAGEA